MKKNRYLLCLLLTGGMIYFAGPRLPIDFNGQEGIFTVSWTAFALLVFAGNLQGIFPQRREASSRFLAKSSNKKKVRSFHN